MLLNGVMQLERMASIGSETNRLMTLVTNRWAETKPSGVVQYDNLPREAPDVELSRPSRRHQLLRFS